MSQPSIPQYQNRGVSYLYMAAAFVVVVAGMRAAVDIVNPMLLAVFLSVISAPSYFGLLKKGVSNWLALLIVIGVLSCVVIGVVFVVTESIAGFTSRQEHYRELITERTAGMRKQFDSWLPEWVQPKPEESPSADTRNDPDSNTDNLETAAPDSQPGNSETTITDDNDLSAETSGNKPTATEVTEATEGTSPETLNEEGESLLSENDSDVTESVETLSGGTSKEADSGSTIFSSPAFGLVESARPLPRNEQGWRKYMSEQFNLGTAFSLANIVVSSLGQLLSNTFLILLTVVFILLEAGTFTRKIKDAFIRTEEATQSAQQIINSIQHYIVIKTWVSLATGLFVALWLKFLGVPYAGLWGLLAFLFNYVPNVGSIIAAIPAVLIAWLELTTLPAIACAIGFVFVNGVIGNFIEPRLMGKGLGLSPLVVFFSMVFWGWVLGPIGMLLSVPLTMTARIALEGFDDTRWMATLMGNADESC